MGRIVNKVSINHAVHALFVSHIGIKLQAQELKELRLEIHKSLDIDIRRRHSIKGVKDDRSTRKSQVVEQSGKTLRLAKETDNFKVSVKDDKTLITKGFQSLKLTEVLLVSKVDIYSS